MTACVLSRARLRRVALNALQMACCVALCATAAACATIVRRPPCAPAQFATAYGTCVPEAWHCSPSLYNAGAADGCDCNCGAPDPDCHRRTKTFWCYGFGMARQVASCSLCDAAPGERLMQQLFGTSADAAAEPAP